METEIQMRSRKELMLELEKLRSDFDRVNELYHEDLADRKSSEDELRNSLSLLEAILESTENGILVIGEKGTLVKANLRFAQLWHIPEEIIDSGDDERMLNHIINQLSEPDSFLAKVRGLYADPFAESFDMLYFTDGRIFERISKPMIVGGQVIARVWSFLDITERSRTEQERQVMFEISEGVTTTSNLDEMLGLIHQALRKVIYAENFFIALHDPDTGLFSFPYFVDQLDEKPFPVAMPKSCTAYVYRTGNPLLLTPELFSQLRKKHEVELVGSPAPSWIGVPLQTPNSVIGVLVLQHYEKGGVFKEHDVKFLSAIGNQAALVIERKNTEVALFESEKKFRRLMTNISDVMYSVDGKTGEYNYLSPAFLNLTGYTPEDVIRMGGRKSFLAQTIPPGKLAEHHDRFSRLQNEITDIVFMDEIWWCCKDGSVKCIADHWIPVYENGQLISTDGVLRDITERKNSEEEIKRMNAQLQEIIAAKDKFFSILAHDLRSPFNSFLGFTQLLSEELENLSKKEIQRIASSMKSSAFNVYRLLDNLLEWSRFQRGMTTCEPELFLFLPLISDCLDLIQESGKKKQIEIIYEIPSTMLVYADKHMLETILRNLLTNAVKFTPKGGRITISGASTDDQGVEIAVRDSGIGMSPVMIGSLFDINEQIKRSGTEGEPSSGLGLIICKEFVEKHGGRIWVESEEGKGSIFRFTLKAETDTDYRF